MNCFVKRTLREGRSKMQTYAAKSSMANTDTLSCLCGISTYVLFVFLKENGYNPVFCMNDLHCFLKLDGYWIDLTLRQFVRKAPQIYCRRTPYQHDEFGRGVHAAKQSAKTLKKVRRMFKGWPLEQNPFKQKGLPKIHTFEITA
jgi:hypothetical protein